MKKKWFIFSLVVLFLITLSGSAFAWSKRVEGKPDQFRSGGVKGYFIWHDEDGLHIWTTTRGANHVFTGVIKTDGHFANVKGHRLDDGDFLKNYPDVRDKFWFHFWGTEESFNYNFGGREVVGNKDTIRFSFNTAGGTDGINFRLKNGSRVTFELYMDGQIINPKEIYVGDHGWHPNHSTFTLSR